MNEAAKEKRDTEMFGMPEQMMRDTFEDRLFGTPPAMLVVAILSDAQHQIEQGNLELARQTINRAKFGIVEYVAPTDDLGRIADEGPTRYRRHKAAA